MEKTKNETILKDESGYRPGADAFKITAVCHDKSLVDRGSPAEHNETGKGYLLFVTQEDGTQMVGSGEQNLTAIVGGLIDCFGLKQVHMALLAAKLQSRDGDCEEEQ